jgi:hypothetical protein
MDETLRVLCWIAQVELSFNDRGKLNCEKG